MDGQLARQAFEQDPSVRKHVEFLKALLAEAAVGPFSVRLWDGTEWQHGQGPPRFTLVLKHPSSLRRLLWRPNELSLGEAYIYNEFDVLGDLEASFELGEYLFQRKWRWSEKLRLGGKLLGMAGAGSAGTQSEAARLSGRTHSKQRDAQAVQYHYNISNDFYRLWLDKHMVYSCALFHSPEESLDDAQFNKLNYLCRKLRLKPGDRLLDIGCGWGGLIMHAAEHFGVEALGITLSQPQADLANARIREAGLAERCRAEICDYRDVPDDRPFDKLVSVGMVEHVGEAKLPEYFRKAYEVLKPGGTFLNHGITESLQRENNRGPSFIDKYVFPDGELLPITTSLRVAEEIGFEIRDVEGLREHYAMTLRHWVSRLEARREQAIALTSPETYRIWRIYMAGSAFSFETGRIGIYQTLLVKAGRQAPGLPLTRCDWYRECPSSFH